MNFIKEELARLREDNLFRRMRRIDGGQSAWTVMDGKRVLLLASNSYLGLTTHPALKAAAVAAVERYGTGTGGSRLTTGNFLLHEELERTIAGFKETEAALVFNTGYMANLGVISALTGPEDAVFSDQFNHASIIDGCRLSKAKVKVYKHKDLDHLRQLLRAAQQGVRRKLIVTDGVFSMDGDIAPLDRIVELAEAHDALVMVDDAHATGVLGAKGGGTVQHFGLKGRVHIQMGTLSKALASEGGYVAGSQDLIDYLRNKARSFIFSTSLPPADMAAAQAAIGVILEEPARRRQLWDNVRYLHTGLSALGFTLPPEETPILPLLLGDAGLAMHLAEHLLAQGVFAPGIRPPTVPPGTSRIRITVMATHTRADLDKALAAFENAGRALGII